MTAHPTLKGRLRAARKALGLSDSEMAAALHLRGNQAKDDYRKMEEGVRPVTGPVLVAAELMAAASKVLDEESYLDLSARARASFGALTSLVPVLASANPHTPPSPEAAADGFADLVAELADTPTTDETPGVAADPLGDEIVRLARRWHALEVPRP